MKPKTLLRVSLAAWLAGGTLTTIGCGDLVRQSVRDGLFNYIAGTVSSGLDASVFGEFVTNVFTGGFGWDTSGGAGTSSGFDD